MKINNIVITHGYSDSNKGDLAITQGTYNGLKKMYPNASFTLLSTFREADPDFWYHNRKMKENEIEIIQGILPTPYIGTNSSFIMNVLAVLRLLKDYLQLKGSLLSSFFGKMLGGKQYKALKRIKDADMIIVKGGQFIYNDKEDLRGNLFLWRTLQPLKVGRKLNKKVIVLCQSIGGFATEKSEKYAMKYLSYCDKIIVREKLSLDLLNKYNIKNVELKPDIAFYIDKKEVKIKEEIVNKGNLLGITVVNWSFAESKNPVEARQNYIINLTLAIEEVYNRLNLFPVFIPQVTVRHHGKSDLDLIKIIQNNLEDKGVKSYTFTEDYTASEMAGLYSKCKLLIGTRLHSCILAAVAETPIIAIRYQGFKTQGVMEMLGFENLVHDIHQLDGNKLIEDIETVIENHKMIKSKIVNKTTQLRSDISGMLLTLEV